MVIVHGIKTSAFEFECALIFEQMVIVVLEDNTPRALVEPATV